MKERLIIIGAGAHSKVVVDIIEMMGTYEIEGLIDDHESIVLGYKVIGTDDSLERLFSSGINSAFVAIGNNAVRERLYKQLKAIGFNIVNAISPYAVISKHAHIGDGVAVMPGAVINADTHIGDGVIINTNASIDHDCFVGSFSHVAPGANVCGSCNIGTNCMLGVGCKVIDKTVIGDNTIVGAGAVVIKDIADNTVAVGVPAREIGNNYTGREVVKGL